MAKIDYIKLGKLRADGKREIITRIYVSGTQKPQVRTGIYIAPNRFKNLDSTKRCRLFDIEIPREGVYNVAEVKELREIKNAVNLYFARLQKYLDIMPHEELNTDGIKAAMYAITLNSISVDEITRKEVVKLLEKHNKEKDGGISFFDYMCEYRDNSKKKVNGKREGEKSKVWKNNFDVLLRALQRYENFMRYTEKGRTNWSVSFDSLNADELENIESFLRNESELHNEYPELFTGARVQKTRGNNTICALFNKLRAFYSWANENEITDKNPFVRYNGITAEKYGTPYYLTIEERNAIASHDFEPRNSLATQRDIFIFQCCIGCRVSDLLRLTSDNIINGAIEYIPTKTKGESSKVVRVPLNDRAAQLIAKYKGVNVDGGLFPFISAQKYNVAIKQIFKSCGITRMVTILDSVTGKEKQIPINEVASSHIARRTFIGNLYSKVKDPNLIGAMSGHAENSKAFARYRAIGDEIKKEVITLID